MPTVHDVEAALYDLAPRDLAMDFDNVGHLVGDCEKAVHKVLVALDITPGVVREAADLGCDLIVSHHPVIFPGRSNLRTVRSDDPTGRLVMELIRRDMAAICMHTNLDVTDGGVNDALAAALELQDVLFPQGADVERVGYLPHEMRREDFLAHVQTCLHPNGIRYAGGGDRPIHKVAVGGGSCGDFFAAAAALGCDAFVTADVKYNQFLSAQDLGLCLVDAGHFPTENVVCPVIADCLAQKFPALTIVTSSSHREVINYYVKENK